MYHDMNWIRRLVYVPSIGSGILVVVPEYAQHRAPIEIFFSLPSIWVDDDDDDDDDHNEFYDVVAVIDNTV